MARFPKSASKRKRTSTTTTKNKRQKKAISSSSESAQDEEYTPPTGQDRSRPRTRQKRVTRLSEHGKPDRVLEPEDPADEEEEGEEDTQVEEINGDGKLADGNWLAKAILDEDEDKDRYLIDWLGTDPETNRPWIPTWEPKAFANKLLVEDWLKEKEERARAAALSKRAPRKSGESSGNNKKKPSANRDNTFEQQGPLELQEVEAVQDRQTGRLTRNTREAREIDETPSAEDSAPTDPQRVSRGSATRQPGSDYEVPGWSASVLTAASDVQFGQSSRSEGPPAGTQSFVEDSESEDGSASYLPSTAQISASVVGISSTQEASTRSRGTEGDSSAAALGSIATSQRTKSTQGAQDESQRNPDVAQVEEPALPQPNQTISQNQYTSNSVSLQTSKSDNQDIGGSRTHTQTQPETIEIPDEIPETPYQEEPESEPHPPASFIEEIGASLPFPQSASEEASQPALNCSALGAGECVAHNPHLPDHPPEKVASTSASPVEDVREPNQRLGDINEVDQISCHDFAHSQACDSATQVNNTGSLPLADSNLHQEQHAQIVPSSPYLSTQLSIEDVLPTTEVSFIPDRQPATPQSRHDSSQESERGEGSPSKHLLEDLSIPPPPPSRSLEEPDSHLPPRPRTPIFTSSLTDPMEYPDEDFATRARREFESLHQKKWGTRRQERLGSQGMEGTRSPSTIPDQPPQGPAPPPLLTTALINSAAVQIPEMPLDDATSVLPTNHPQPPAAVAKEVAEPARRGWSPLPESSAGESASSAEEIRSDSGDSYLEDEISLADDRLGEHIVPLTMGGRQKDAYLKEIRRRKDLLQSFGMDPSTFQDLHELDEIFNRLRAVETHVDLIWAESASADASASAQRQAQWDVDSSVKFAFLSALLGRIKERDWHIILVLKDDNERLFEILTKFLRGHLVNYHYPAKSQQADFSEVEGSVKVTLLSCDSSFIVSPADVIIALDGASTAEIGKRNWAVNPDKTQVPLLQLVIPRSVSHIKLSLNPKLTKRERLHTVVACLSQLHSETGRPLVDTPREDEAANLVAHYLVSADIASQNDESWPLPPIHSIKDVIEHTPQQYSSQLSQARQASATPAPQGASKRPLESQDAAESESSKRRRTSPYADVTHISDSMPGTAVEASASLREAQLQKQLDKTLAELRHSREQRDKDVAELRHFREQEATWDRRQTEYEELAKQHRLIRGLLEDANEKSEQEAKNKDFMLQRIDKLRTENSSLKTRLEELQQQNLASSDELVVENTKLRTQLRDAELAKESAEKREKSTNTTMDYMRDQLQTAQARAIEHKTRLDESLATIARLETQASGEVAKLKQIHVSKAYETAMKHLSQKTLELEAERKLSQRKDDEIQRLKSEKKAYGTRQSSVPRSPRVGPGSRAASPLPGARDRVNHLRNG